MNPDINYRPRLVSLSVLEQNDSGIRDSMLDSDGEDDP